MADGRQQTADSRQQTADSRQQIADRRPQIADSRQQTADSRQQRANGYRVRLRTYCSFLIWLVYRGQRAGSRQAADSRQDLLQLLDLAGVLLSADFVQDQPDIGLTLQLLATQKRNKSVTSV
jgi:hypothetical protein